MVLYQLQDFYIAAVLMSHIFLLLNDLRDFEPHGQINAKFSHIRVRHFDFTLTSPTAPRGESGASGFAKPRVHSLARLFSSSVRPSRPSSPPVSGPFPPGGLCPG